MNHRIQKSQNDRAREETKADIIEGKKKKKEDFDLGLLNGTFAVYKNYILKITEKLNFLQKSSVKSRKKQIKSNELEE